MNIIEIEIRIEEIESTFKANEKNEFFYKTDLADALRTELAYLDALLSVITSA